MVSHRVGRVPSVVKEVKDWWKDKIENTIPTNFNEAVKVVLMVIATGFICYSIYHTNNLVSTVEVTVPVVVERVNTVYVYTPDKYRRDGKWMVRNMESKR